MSDHSAINITEELIIGLSAGSFFCLFGLTALLNFISVKQGKKPITHTSSLLAGKIINVIFIVLVASLSFFGVIPTAHWLDFLYLFICINAAIKINWNLFAATDTSMHTKLLTTINRLGPISKAHLLQLYNREAIFSARIPRLLALGQIQILNGKYLLSGNFVLYGAKVLALFRLILGIPVRPPLNLQKRDDQ